MFAEADLDDEGTAGRLLRADLARRLSVKESEFHNLGLALGYDYPDSPVVVADGRPVPAQSLPTYVPSAHPGARLPHTWLPDGTSLVHLPELRPRFDADLVLVRPDQHVAWRGSGAADPADLLRPAVGGADHPNVVASAPSHLEEISR